MSIRSFFKSAALAAIALSAALSADAAKASDAGEVNLYSYRQPFLINPILEVFSKETGIKVNIVYAKDGILERLKAEGDNSPADAVLTADVGRLHDMVEAGVLQAVQSDTLDANIPTQYRHPDGLWYGLTVRSRIIFESAERATPGLVTSYADLARPELKGRICSRSAKNVYNVSLIASLIAHDGVEATHAWLEAVRDNLARKPQGNDRAQAKAIAEGLCDYALANTYYYGKMATNDKEPEQKEWANAVRIVFPDQNGRGAHVNISGAGVTKSAPNRENAIRLLEFLSDGEAQRLYAEQNFEYPMKPGIDLHPLVASWGAFNADTINLADVAEHRSEASRLVDETGFDFGPGGS